MIFFATKSIKFSQSDEVFTNKLEIKRIFEDRVKVIKLCDLIAWNQVSILLLFSVTNFVLSVVKNIPVFPTLKILLLKFTSDFLHLKP